MSYKSKQILTTKILKVLHMLHCYSTRTRIFMLNANCCLVARFWDRVTTMPNHLANSSAWLEKFSCNKQLWCISFHFSCFIVRKKIQKKPTFWYSCQWEPLLNPLIDPGPLEMLDIHVSSEWSCWMEDSCALNCRTVWHNAGKPSTIPSCI